MIPANNINYKPTITKTQRSQRNALFNTIIKRETTQLPKNITTNNDTNILYKAQLENMLKGLDYRFKNRPFPPAPDSGRANGDYAVDRGEILEALGRKKEAAKEYFKFAFPQHENIFRGPGRWDVVGRCRNGLKRILSDPNIK